MMLPRMPTKPSTLTDFVAAEVGQLRERAHTPAFLRQLVANRLAEFDKTIAAAAAEHETAQSVAANAAAVQVFGGKASDLPQCQADAQAAETRLSGLRAARAALAATGEHAAEDLMRSMMEGLSEDAKALLGARSREVQLGAVLMVLGSHLIGRWGWPDAPTDMHPAVPWLARERKMGVVPQDPRWRRFLEFVGKASSIAGDRSWITSNDSDIGTINRHIEKTPVEVFNEVRDVVRALGVEV